MHNLFSGSLFSENQLYTNLFENIYIGRMFLKTVALTYEDSA